MCHPACEVEAGVSLYRDANHLSRAGALRYAPQVGAFIERLTDAPPSTKTESRAAASTPPDQPGTPAATLGRR